MRTETIFYREMFGWFFLLDRVVFISRLEYRLRIWRPIASPVIPRKVRKDKGTHREPKVVTAEIIDARD